MSYFENHLLAGEHRVVVPSQGDEPYRSIAQNQCGWAAFEFAAASRALREAYAARDDAAFCAAYGGALAAASGARAAAQAAPDANPSGENVDHAAVLARHAAAVALAPIAGAPDGAAAAVLELHKPLRDLSFYPACEAREWFEAERPRCARLDGGRAALAAALAAAPLGRAFVFGRFHEAFAAARLGSEEAAPWLVMDSHVRAAGAMSAAALVDYIEMMVGGEAYSCIVMVSCDVM
jgi:hypothetical protein